MGLIQFKRTRNQTLSDSVRNTILNFGEPFYDQRRNLLYIGDGSTAIKDLPYIGKNVMDSLKTLLYNNTTDTAVKANQANQATNVTDTIASKAISSIFESDGVTVKTATSAKSAIIAGDVASKINGQLISSIFESDKVTVKKATNASNVTGKINGKAISTIFDSDGTTVNKAKEANYATSAGTASQATMAGYASEAGKAATADKATQADRATRATYADNTSATVTIEQITQNIESYAQDVLNTSRTVIASVSGSNIGLPSGISSGIIYMTKQGTIIQILLLSGNNIYTKSKNNTTWTTWATISLSGHTHYYAGSDSIGGAANNAVNVTTNINGKAISTIFESDGKKVKNATNADTATNAATANAVSTTIGGRLITNIFESGSAKVKNATNADYARDADSAAYATSAGSADVAYWA